MNFRLINRRVVAVLCSAAAVAMAAGPAAASVGTAALVTTACTTVPTASTSAAPDGQVRGFVETGCGSNGAIAYVTNALTPDTWRTTPTPYRGLVLATAQDATATYLLYRASDGVRITKVLHNGGFTGGNLLSKAAGGGLEGSVAARGGLWMAVWTEPKASGGFGMHAAGSRNYVASPKDRILPAGAGIDDSAPVLAPAAFGSGYLLAFSRHDASGYHLMLAQGFPRKFTAREVDQSDENPQASLFRAGHFTFLAWIHNTSLRMATTAGHLGKIVPLYQVAVPQAPGPDAPANPRLGVGCGRLFIGFQVDSESSGDLWVDNQSTSGAWVRQLVRHDPTAAPSLAGLAPNCAASVLLWTSAAKVLGATVS